MFGSFFYLLVPLLSRHATRQKWFWHFFSIDSIFTLARCRCCFFFIWICIDLHHLMYWYAFCSAFFSRGLYPHLMSICRYHDYVPLLFIVPASFLSLSSRLLCLVISDPHCHVWLFLPIFHLRLFLSVLKSRCSLFSSLLAPELSSQLMVWGQMIDIGFWDPPYI